MNAADRHGFNDALRENAATCEAIAERVEKYAGGSLSLGEAELVTALLALTEAIRILVRVQMYRD